MAEGGCRHPAGVLPPQSKRADAGQGGGEETAPLGPDVLVYKVAGKMFALAGMTLKQRELLEG